MNWVTIIEIWYKIGALTEGALGDLQAEASRLATRPSPLGNPRAAEYMPPNISWHKNALAGSFGILPPWSPCDLGCAMTAADCSRKSHPLAGGRRRMIEKTCCWNHHA